MKASDFVKQCGFSEAKRVLHDARGCVGVKLWGRYEFSTDDLKRLVESHDLVEKAGGLNAAYYLVSRADDQSSDSIVRLKQAIKDMESCQ